MSSFAQRGHAPFIAFQSSCHARDIFQLVKLLDPFRSRPHLSNLGF
jgi:hypothetical protein